MEKVQRPTTSQQVNKYNYQTEMLCDKGRAWKSRKGLILYKISLFIEIKSVN
jgi:hypothetical protein